MTVLLQDVAQVYQLNNMTKIHEGRVQMTEDEQTLVCDKHSQVGDYTFFDLIPPASRTVPHMQCMLN